MNFDKIIQIYDNNKDKIDRKTCLYYNYVKSNPSLYHTFKRVCKKIKQQYEINQQGGSVVVVGGITLASISMVSLIGVAAFLLYRMFKNKCATSYPMYPKDQDVTFKDLLYIFVTPELFPKSLTHDKNTSVNKFNPFMQFMQEIGSYDKEIENMLLGLSVIEDAVNVIDPKSPIGKTLMKLVQTLVGATAAVATGGMGGDMIVGLIFTIKNAIAFLMRILSMVKYLMLFIPKLCSDEATDFLHYVYDILNINFSGGPIGVKCQYEYIKSQYPQQKTLQLLFCKVFSQLYMSFTEFFGTMIASFIPDNANLVGIAITTILQSNITKNVAINLIIKQILKYYNKIPPNLRIILENPDLMYALINCVFSMNSIQLIFDAMDSLPMLAFNPALKISSKIAKKITKKILLGKNAKQADQCKLENIIKSKTHIDATEDTQPLPPQKQPPSKTEDNYITTLMEIIKKYSKLIAFILNKLLALSFVILYVTKDCPMGTSLDEAVDEHISTSTDTCDQQEQSDEQTQTDENENENEDDGEDDSKDEGENVDENKKTNKPEGQTQKA